MMDVHARNGGMGVLHLIRVEDPSAFGCVVHDADGRVRSFLEKPKREEAPTNEVNAGTYLLDPAILKFIPAGRMVSIERETFPAVIDGAKPLYAYTTDDYWLDLGKPEAYLASHRDIFEGTMPLGLNGAAGGPGAAGVPPSAVVAPVFVGRGVRVHPDARIGPYTVLGDGCEVGRGAGVRHSLLWDRVVVEEEANVDSSIVASRARIGNGAVVRAGAVIGHDAVIAPGSLIEEDARVTAH